MNLWLFTWILLFLFTFGSSDFWGQLCWPKSALVIFIALSSQQRAKNTDDCFDPEILSLNFEMKFCLYPEIYLPWTMCKTDRLCSKAPPLGAVNVDTSTPPAQVSKVSCAGPTGFNSHSKVYSMVALIFPKKDGLCLFLLSNNFFFFKISTKYKLKMKNSLEDSCTLFGIKDTSYV